MNKGSLKDHMMHLIVVSFFRIQMVPLLVGEGWATWGACTVAGTLVTAFLNSVFWTGLTRVQVGGGMKISKLHQDRHILSISALSEVDQYGQDMN